MKRLLLVVGTAIVLLPWLAAARVQAEPIQWSASDSVYTHYFTPQGGGDMPGMPASTGVYPSLTPGGIQLVAGGNTSGTNSGSVLLAGLVAYRSTFGSQSGDSIEFGGFVSNASLYQLTLLLHDQASRASGTLTFSGYFSGQLQLKGGGGTTLTNTFVDPTTQSLKLGSNLYTVTIGPVVLPQDTYDDPNGSISATISVQPLTSATPEPSSLLLACLAVPPLGLARWLRRRKQVASNA